MTDTEKETDFTELVMEITYQFKENDEKLLLEMCNRFLNTHYIQEVDKQELVNALESYRQYRWHDLRKNPDDLPKESDGEFYDDLLLQFGSGHVCLGWYRNDDGHFYRRDAGGFVDMYTNRVIAWKYIEPFKE